MPEWATGITLGEIGVWAAGAAAVVLLVVRVRKFFKPLTDLLQSFREFLAEWNGRPAELDASGAEKSRAEPGMLARVGALEKSMAAVRHQVKNDHETNLRDDVDRTILGMDKLSKSLTEHIEIAKRSDQAQVELAATVREHLPMLKQLHAVWVAGTRQQPEGSDYETS